MKTRPTKSETALLEQWRVALKNALSQPEIKTRIEEFGYNIEKLQEGQTLWQNTKDIWDLNKKENLETKEASNNFKEQKQKLFKLYTSHRKKAKAKFKRKPETLVLLQLTGIQPNTYLSLLQTIKHFYTQINQNQEIANQLITYNIPQEEFTRANELIEQTEIARAEYLREDGESQDATKQKDTALTNLEHWMQDFYAMSSIALEKNEQLLEAIGLFRKS